MSHFANQLAVVEILPAKSAGNPGPAGRLPAESWDQQVLGAHAQSTLASRGAGRPGAGTTTCRKGSSVVFIMHSADFAKLPLAHRKLVQQCSVLLECRNL